MSEKLTYKNIELSEIKSHNSNPWGLVYSGAITENEKEKVNIQPITYDLNGIKIMANIYTPANYNPNEKYPAITVAHPNGGVKEQVAGLYAQKLAEAGYITITADAAYQGASGGIPRSTDKPQFRTEDIHRMVDILSIFPGVDTDRVGALGICGGGGYTLKATQADKRFKAIATISMFNSGVVRRDGFANSQKNTLQERLEQATKARQQEVNGGEILYTPDLKNITPEEADKLPYDLYREGYYYYAKDFTHPNSTFVYTQSSILDLVKFDAAENMNMINKPLLMIAGEKADSLYMTEDAYKKATGTNDKELFLIKGATHIQTYWKPEFVEQITDKLVKFYRDKL